MSRMVLLGLIMAYIFTSCGNVAVYNNNIDIPHESWNMDSIATFNVDINDTSSIHSVFVNVRNTTSYPNSNLFLFIHTKSPKGITLRDTIECFLANTKGEWLGRGFGALRDNQIPYKRYIRFPDVGTYEFSVQQGMRATSLKGIASIGIRVEKHKN